MSNATSPAATLAKSDRSRKIRDARELAIYAANTVAEIGALMGLTRRAAKRGALLDHDLAILACVAESQSAWLAGGALERLASERAAEEKREREIANRRAAIASYTNELTIHGCGAGHRL